MISPANIHARQIQIVQALPIGETLFVEFGRILGIHQVRGEGAGIATEQCVRERDVAPVEASIVQPHEKQRERVDETCGGVGAQHAVNSSPGTASKTADARSPAQQAMACQHQPLVRL